ncbi:CDP-glycerol glycerophosphotransferase family protein [Nocardioides sp. KIGAM211]|uniref:CDP-glycerol glycerophosphotransferase family protein n=1 Tax=Nocardioides luti TaxID=2761101 RepID=A0A7X0RFP1_9ACTN|nr:CDP-glycerol glycerophosphotransferase family protein [Nocardioides luti]MBB6627441.1 CDP-glycerol glycerophosphotransferase family protein [Nocardioides luti]
MAGPSSPRRIAGAAAAVLPPGARRALRRRLGARLGVPGADAGLVSVVLVVEARDLPRLSASLASALGQEHAHLEVLVCPVGEDAARDAALVVHDVGDARVVPVEPSATWQQALEAGVARAHGDLLAFLRGCDRLPPDALAVAARSLAASGADLATGRLEQSGSPEPWLAAAQQRAHDPAATGVAPTARPGLAGALALGGLVVRRPAWRGGLTRTDDWVTSPTVAALLAGVARVDVLDHPTYTFAPGHGVRAFAATPSALPDLPVWRERVAAVDHALTGSPLLDGWHRHLAAVELPRLLQDAERATPEEWSVLRTLAGRYAGPTGPAADEVPAAARALGWLAAEDRRPEVEALAAELAALDGDLPTRLVDGGLHATWDAVALPADLTRLAASETPLRAHAQRTRWTAGGREVDVLAEVRLVDAGAVPLEVAVDADGAVEVLRPARIDAEATRWAGRRFQEAVALTVRVPGDGATTLRLTASGGGVTRSSTLALPARPTGPAAGTGSPVTVDGLALDGTDLVVTATGDPASLRLLGPDDRPLDVVVRPVEGGARITLRADHFGAPRWLASGPHRLVTRDGNVAVGDGLRGRLPTELVGERHRVRAFLGPRGGLVLGVTAPLTDDELGPHAQQRLQTAYALDDRPLDPDLAYFDTYAGRSATDSPRAIHDELRRRRPHLRTVWGVADHGQSVPAGAEPMLLRSAAWYAALASARVVVTNTDVEAWFRRRPGQVLLQTFHGYPSKAMGLGQWRALDHAPSRIRVARARGVDTWSAIVTPTPEMTRHYREQYAYDGPALEHGYPRDDDLVLPTAAATRERTRTLLGIAPDQTAVLYAPTWREHLAFRARGAEMTDFLDVAAAARALGDDHVLLLRGHRFHQPDPGPVDPATGAGTPAARVVDVTAYPEINDLVLASDAAVLDYSSLRFDYALTGRPMVFLVPDLAAYDAGSRSFLFPFEESAPGPFVDDTAGVVAALRDLDGLRERHAPAIAAFNDRFNPWQDGRAAERVVDGLLDLL